MFANIVLADEINRTPPKTQAALLQAMQERQVTVGAGDLRPARAVLRHRHAESRSSRKAPIPCPRPSSTASCSISSVDYPSFEEEKRILAMVAKDESRGTDESAQRKAIVNLQKLIRSVPVGDFVIDFATRLARASRPSDSTAPDFVKKLVDWGAGAHGHRPHGQPARRSPRWMGDSASRSMISARRRFRCFVTASAPTSRPRPRAKAARMWSPCCCNTVGEPEPAKYAGRRNFSKKGVTKKSDSVGWVETGLSGSVEAHRWQWWASTEPDSSVSTHPTSLNS